ncbi:hypothetical protein [Hoyosella subflava]|uniref:Uncharacterized protein n=1 Tax=Hoyosella subflava (strain DSM 45089 / JCM 17490 / NBRC 109087 / DQS3-9A1) TaxID=443218 RepID=F6EI48_HOYSD|nr:hypothetical protein [Hoyosella subflava]AEF41155.1 hypothetical protein AS9A_2708 [Hoyosella subflava DQS3-9A1]
MSGHAHKESSNSGVVLTGTGVLFLFLLLRLLAVSGYDWHIAFAVIHTVDLNEGFAILIGTLMAEPTFTGIALAVLLPLALLRLLWPMAGHNRVSGLVLLAVLVTAFVSLIATHHLWWLVAVAIAIGFVVALLELMRHHDRLHEAGVFLLHRIGLVTGAFLLALAALVTTPWVPLEEITLTDETIRGYVMETSPGFLKILTEADREFLIIPSGEVEARAEVD